MIWEYWLDICEYYRELKARNFKILIQKAKIFKNKLKSIDTTDLLIINDKENVDNKEMW
jgi:hypothetical protein